MKPLSDLFDRFRRTAGVPAAAADDLTAELAPVFAALEEIDAAAAEVRARAARPAEERLADRCGSAGVRECGTRTSLPWLHNQGRAFRQAIASMKAATGSSSSKPRAAMS